MPLAIFAKPAVCFDFKQYIHPEITWGGESRLQCLNQPSHTDIVPQTLALVMDCVIHTNVTKNAESDSV